MLSFLAFNPLAMLRRRLAGVFAAFAFSACCCLTGTLMAFVAAPRQALQAYHISQLPPMSAATVAAAAPGAEILVTGILGVDYLTIYDLSLLAHTDEQWRVSVATGTNGNSATSTTGQWVLISTVVPDADLLLDAQKVRIQGSSSVQLSGPLHERIVKSDSSLVASDNGQPLPDGSHRFRSIAAGDVTTLWGTKGADQTVIPKELFLGDRPAYETSQQQAASALLISGLCALAAAPVVLIVGLLGVVFWRRR